MRAKSFTLDGKRHKIHPQIPLQEIRWLVGRQHVGEPDTTIEALFDERAKTWPEKAIASAKKFAIWCHRRNQILVREMRL
ncbi:hypothetical protein NKK48_01355 [Mesorhizobium sp. C386A]|uniref:hypothetical protein n=1 Tax=unclassified Mesorhizobium TaxID=325217 RepID=UPI0003CE920F|nr:hypothetical protein [Mesorhizobium sp. LNJC386A00]ESY35727.1 hypothetical protein X748_14025 [Mesorhizobium sp. LNJC386A00]